MHSIPPVSRSITLSPSHSLHHTILLSAYIHLCLYLLDPPLSHPSFYMHSIPPDSRSISLSISLPPSHHPPPCLFSPLSISSWSSTLTSFFLFLQYLCLFPPPPPPADVFLIFHTYVLRFRFELRMFVFFFIDKDIPRSKFRGWTHVIQKVW